jgi:hypothetical protein
METMGLWRATTAQQNHSKAEEVAIAVTIADNTNRMKQIATPENTAISPQTSHPYTTRRRRRFFYEFQEERQVKRTSTLTST